MNKCTVCGEKVGFLWSVCDACLQAQDGRQEKSAQLSSKRVSEGFYISSIVGSILLAVFLFLVTFATASASQKAVRVGSARQDETTLTVMLLLAVALLLYADVVFLVLLYKAWAAIQDGHVRTTPGKAVGFLFIPLFNIYWLFEAFPGFVEDYNSYLVRHELSHPKLSKGAFQAFAILSILSIVPCVGSIVAVVLVVLVCILATRMCEAVNALPLISPPKYLIKRAAAHYKKGDLDGALTIFDRALQLVPNHAETYIRRGYIRYLKEDLDGAISDCDRSIEIDSQLSEAYYIRGTVRQAKDDLNGAIADFSRAIEISPGHALAYANRGIARLLQGEESEADKTSLNVSPSTMI